MRLSEIGYLEQARHTAEAQDCSDVASAASGSESPTCLSLLWGFEDWREMSSLALALQGKGQGNE